MENVQFPQFLSDIAILKAKHDALEASFLNFVKEIRPERFEIYQSAYEQHYKKLGLKYIYEIPAVDEALREEIRRQLGL